MKRRNFFGALAAVVAAPKVLLSLAKPEEPAAYHAKFEKSEEAFRYVRYVGRSTVRNGLPIVQWRQVNAGDVVELMQRTNDVLLDMPWRDSRG